MTKKPPLIVRAFVVASLAGALFAGMVVRDRIAAGVPISTTGVVASPSLLASRDTEPVIPESDYFFRITELLKNEYVEPVTDEQKLAVGAVRGMVGSLADPLANFMSADQFKTYQDSLKGTFQGIGVEVRYEFDQAQVKRAQQGDRTIDPASLVPKLLVATVVPDGPASRAGLKTGDRIDSVGGKWVLSTSKIMEFRETSKKLRLGGSESDDIAGKLKLLQESAKSGITPARARDRVSLGTSGSVLVIWERGGKMLSADIPKTKMQVPATRIQRDGSIALRLFSGADSELRKAIAGRNDVVLDLRNSTQGDFAQVTKCLSALAPTGSYGEIAAERGAKPIPLKVLSGRAEKVNLTLLVDGSTRGAAEILALALSSKGVATLKGTATAGERATIQVSSLPDGSGYVIPTGRYRVTATPKGVKK